MARQVPREGPLPTTAPVLLYQNDPIRLAVQRLGRKWVLLLVRDLAFLKLRRFGEFRRNNPGLSPRVLSRRLREMEQGGLLVRHSEGREIDYRLTPRGEDAAFILLAFLRYGLRHHVGPTVLPRGPPSARTGVPRASGGKNGGRVGEATSGLYR